jgi:hypothetical protein
MFPGEAALCRTGHRHPPAQDREDGCNLNRQPRLEVGDGRVSFGEILPLI